MQIAAEPNNRILFEARQSALGETGAYLECVEGGRTRSLRIELHAAMVNGGACVCSLDESLRAAGTPGEKLEFSLPFFGEWQLELSCFDDGDLISQQELTLRLIAEEYNIAPLIATTPVLLFMLKYFAGDVAAQMPGGSAIPTILCLTRSGMIDWDLLPDGMYENPFYLADQGAPARGDGTSPLQRFDEAICAYVRKLVEISPQSCFNCYVGDVHAYRLLPSIVADEVLSSRVRLHLISDGDATRDRFEQVYSIEGLYRLGGQERFEFMRDRAGLYLDLIREGRDLPPRGMNLFAGYAPVLLDLLPQTTWWILASKDASMPSFISDEELWARLCEDERVIACDIHELIRRLEDAGSRERLEALFSLGSLEQSLEGVDPSSAICVVGSAASYDPPRAVVRNSGGMPQWLACELEYAKAMQACLGKEMRLFYKPHPSVRFGDDELAAIAEQGIEVLSSQCPLELLCEKHPGLALAGQQSTIHQQAAYADRVVAFFGLSRAQASAGTQLNPQLREKLLDQALFLSYASPSIGGTDGLAWVPWGVRLPKGADQKELGACIFIEGAGRDGLLIWNMDNGTLSNLPEGGVISLPALAPEAYLPLDRVIVTIPAYRPDETLLKVVRDLAEIGFTRCVVVDDGSGEEYAPIFQQVRDELGCLVVDHGCNRGYGRALKTAASIVNAVWARDRSVVGFIQVDSDGQHDPEDAMRVARCFLANPDCMVVGQRDLDAPQVPTRSRAGAAVTRKLLKRLFKIELADTQCGLRAFSMLHIPLVLAAEGERMEYTTGLLLEVAKEYLRLLAVPIKTIYRPGKEHVSTYRTVADSARVAKVMAHRLSAMAVEKIKRRFS